MTRLAPVALALSGLVLPTVASAEVFPYAEVFGGLTYLGEIEIEDEVGDTADVDTETGFNVGGAAGVGFRVPYGFLRVEGELAYRQNAADQLNLFGLAIDDVDGDFSSLSAMGNLLYETVDFDTPLSYWVGAGVGYANLALDLTAAGVDLVDDDAGVFAYQGMAGVTYAFSENINLKFGYTYFATLEPTFEFSGGGGDLDAEYGTHNVRAGIGYNF